MTTEETVNDINEYEEGRSLSRNEFLESETTSLDDIWNQLVNADVESPALYKDSDEEEVARSFPTEGEVTDRGIFDNPLKRLIEERANEFGIAVLEELKALIPLLIWRALTPEQITRIKEDCVRFGICLGQLFIDPDNRPKHRRNLGFIINTMEFEGALAILRAQNQSKSILKDAMKGAMQKILGTGFSTLLGV